MPSSLLAIAPRILDYAYERSVELDRPIRVLDVGVGRGKYGLLLREYLGERLEVVDGVEAEPRYVDAAPWLRSIYGVILTDDVTNFVGPEFDIYDLVLMVDVLEHLTQADGAELLRRIRPPVVVCTPRDYFQNPEAVEYPTEDHRSHWPTARIANVRTIDRHDTAAELELGAVLVRLAPLEPGE